MKCGDNAGKSVPKTLKGLNYDLKWELLTICIKMI